MKLQHHILPAIMAGIMAGLAVQAAPDEWKLTLGLATPAFLLFTHRSRLALSARLIGCAFFFSVHFTFLIWSSVIQNESATVLLAYRLIASLALWLTTLFAADKIIKLS